MNVFEEDIENAIKAEFIPWSKLMGKTILITGATGLIGRTLVNVLNLANKKKQLNLKIIGLVRDEKEQMTDLKI